MYVAAFIPKLQKELCRDGYFPVITAFTKTNSSMCIVYK